MKKKRTNEQRAKSNEVESELILATYGTPLLSPMLNIMVAIVTITLFIGKVAMFNLVLWVSLVSVTSLIRIGTLLTFRRQQPSLPLDRKWGHRIVVVMGLNAAAWGGASYLLFVPNSFEMQMNLAAFVAVTAVFVTMTVSYMPAVKAYVALSMPPIVIMLLFQGTREHYATAAVVITLIILTPLVASKRARSMKELIGLRMALAREKESAEQANLAKSKFLAAASHDLRQPLHALAMFTGTLAMRARKKEDKEIAQHIGDAVSALGMLLNALLDISKLDAGAVVPKLKDFRLAGLLGRLQDEYVQQANLKGLSLSIANCDTAVHSDPALLETIIRNLLSNALRYTNYGSITLRCQHKGRDIVIDVADTGIGIAVEHRREIFREFHQLHNPERDRSQGLGLGLAIVDRLARLLDYRLDLQSEPGKGSVFTITLPQAVGAISASAFKEDIDTEQNSDEALSMCIVVVDDEQTILLATKKLLEHWGHEVIAADSADKAVKLIDHASRAPDAVIADLQLRDNKTGLQAIEAIQSRVGKHIPAIIMTGDITPERMKEMSDNGHYVWHKPVSPARIRAFIRQVQRQLSNHLS
ncbi:ATP-binding response regulator [Geopsychrobacter electrodiphilus]|uniref:ATP-binding response regulator n=1 Tax=Geopsychrobacter electrodiphilus TaxID=225196 RepID=UPI00035F8DF5|nr:hybrid sensor histidine kinase/response regulator [Geopsychrobacter electrodiphilus]